MAVAVINAISNQALRMARSSGEVCTRSYEFDRDRRAGRVIRPAGRAACDLVKEGSRFRLGL